MALVSFPARISAKWGRVLRTRQRDVKVSFVKNAKTPLHKDGLDVQLNGTAPALFHLTAKGVKEGHFENMMAAFGSGLVAELTGFFGEGNNRMLLPDGFTWRINDRVYECRVNLSIVRLNVHFTDNGVWLADYKIDKPW